MGSGEWQSPFRAGVGNGEWGVAEPHGCNPRPDPLLPTHHFLLPPRETDSKLVEIYQVLQHCLARAPAWLPVGNQCGLPKLDEFPILSTNPEQLSETEYTRLVAI